MTHAQTTHTHWDLAKARARVRPLKPIVAQHLTRLRSSLLPSPAPLRLALSACLAVHSDGTACHPSQRAAAAQAGPVLTPPMLRFKIRALHGTGDGYRWRHGSETL